MKRLTTAFLACFTAFYAWAQGAQGEGTALLDDLDSKDRIVVDAFANASNKIHSLIQAVSPKPEMDGYLKNTNFDTSMQASSDPYLRFKGRFGSTGSDISIPLRVIKNDELINYGFTSNTFGIVDVSAEQVVDVARKLGEDAWWSNVMTAIDVSYEEVGVYEWEEEVNVDTDGDGMEDSTEYVTRYDFVTNEVFVGTFAIDLRKWVLDALAKHSPTNLHPDSVKFLNQPERYDVYVSDSFGSDSNFNGRTPFTPFKTIQHAIDYAVSNDIYSVCVASGTYAFPQGYGRDQIKEQTLPRKMLFKAVDGAENTIISYPKAVDIYGADARCSLMAYGEYVDNMVWEGFTFYGLTITKCKNSRGLFTGGYLKDCIITGIQHTDQTCNYLKWLFNVVIFDNCKFYENRMVFDGYSGYTRAASLYWDCYFWGCDIRVKQDEYVRNSNGWISLFNMCHLEDSVVVAESEILTAITVKGWSDFINIVNNIFLYKGSFSGDGMYINYFYNNNLIGNADGGDIRSIVSRASESKWIDYDTAYAFFTNGGTSKNEVDAFGYGDKIRSSVRIWLNSLPIMKSNSVTIQDDTNNQAFMIVKNDGGVLKLYEVVDNTVQGNFAAVGLLGIGSPSPPEGSGREYVKTDIKAISLTNYRDIEE
jgi:hypothetical protein